MRQGQRFRWWEQLKFSVGKLLLECGRALQDRTEGIVPGITDETPEEILSAISRTNSLKFFRTPQRIRQSKALVITCSDAETDWSRICGDFRSYFEVVRLPGAVIPSTAIEAVRLAVDKHKIKLLLIVEHDDCTLLSVRGNEESGITTSYPVLTELRKNHQLRFVSLLNDLTIRRRILAGDLIACRAEVRAESGRLLIRSKVTSQNVEAITASLSHEEKEAADKSILSAVQLSESCELPDPLRHH